MSKEKSKKIEKEIPDAVIKVENAKSTETEVEKKKVEESDGKKVQIQGNLIPYMFLFVIVAAAISLGLCATRAFSSATDMVLTFWVSFLIGLGGAGVYLSLYIMTEKHLKILQNKVIDHLGFMTFIFLLSGGFVAAVTQVSTGPLQNGGIQAVFLVGFGWLGALSGVAGVTETANLNLENIALNLKKLSAENEAKSIEGLKKENIELKKIIEALEKSKEGKGETEKSPESGEESG
ncbi:MAG: hypothetical protein JSV05_03090 [Candidatus Bathyarchaeota archaeon]|nr:MAG: hypothetical protein JSV05_03090 [Candidatus Bathyarchaeota archaeon]